MEDLLKFGLKSKAFDPRAVMDLLYGKVEFHRDYEEHKCVYDWWCYADNWSIIPLEQRMEIVTLVRERIQLDDYGENECFHDRVLCILYTFLKGTYYITENRCSYNIGIFAKKGQNIYTDMFLWWYLGLRKRKKERQLLKECWQEILGCEKPKSQKELLKLVEKRASELKKERQKTLKRERRNERLWDQYRAKAKGVRYEFPEEAKIVRDRWLRLFQVRYEAEKKMHFLIGYLNYVKVSKGLKKKINL